MKATQATYIVDTKTLLDYADAIFGLSSMEEMLRASGKGLRMTVDFKDAHIIIPTVVVREFAAFEERRDPEAATARTILKKLRNLVEGDIHSMEEIYGLRAAVQIHGGPQKISILPVHQDFCKSLSFRPSDTDIGGQIILTALAAAFISGELRVDGSELRGRARDFVTDAVVLVTDDDALAIRARERGILTKRCYTT